MPDCEFPSHHNGGSGLGAVGVLSAIVIALVAAGKLAWLIIAASVYIGGWLLARRWRAGRLPTGGATIRNGQVVRVSQVMHHTTISHVHVPPAQVVVVACDHEHEHAGTQALRERQPAAIEGRRVLPATVLGRQEQEVSR